MQIIFIYLKTMLNRLGVKTIKFYIEGNPIAKQRPRMARGMVYDPQHKEKISLKWQFAKQMRENDFKVLSSQPIMMTLVCYVQIPKSLSQVKQRALKDVFCIKKIDLDNIFKFYSDILNGIAYEDDRLITIIRAEKRYSDNPRVEIEVEALEP